MLLVIEQQFYDQQLWVPWIQVMWKMRGPYTAPQHAVQVHRGQAGS